jgi:Uri superfamily endonuclease
MTAPVWSYSVESAEARQIQLDNSPFRAFLLHFSERHPYEGDLRRLSVPRLLLAATPCRASCALMDRTLNQVPKLSLVAHLVNCGMRLARPVVMAVGALGSHAFPAGLYICTGRASKGLSKRIARHRRAEKRLRWHVDYLLQQAQIEGIQAYPGKATEECSINNATTRVLKGIFPVKGFGSSDCRCISHLMLVPETRAGNLQAVTWSLEQPGNP